jgi:phosphoenolpyruvate synthase/pyruvate phosphate dikinase
VERKGNRSLRAATGVTRRGRAARADRARSRVCRRAGAISRTMVSFLGTYMARGILASDPFVSIDREGVGELVRIGVERGRKTKAKLKVGICGEHGGDPASVAFCHEIALDYVSCSPFRVPIARLAAAQAALGKGPAEA